MMSFSSSFSSSTGLKSFIIAQKIVFSIMAGVVIYSNSKEGSDKAALSRLICLFFVWKFQQKQ